MSRDSHLWVERRKFLCCAGAATVGVAIRPLLSRAVQSQTDGFVGLSLAEASRLVQERKASPVALAEFCLDRIRKFDTQLNSFITVTPDLALSQAKTAEEEIARGAWRGPLHGIPIAFKDNIDTAGIRTTAASAVFADRIPQEDGEVVRRLKTAGAVLLGKLNMHEFANGGSSVVS